MNIKSTLTIGAGALALSALALGAIAAPASAASAPASAAGAPTAAGARMVGPMVWTSGSKYIAGVVGEDGIVKPVEYSAEGTVASYPASGTTGPVMYQGLCLDQVDGDNLLQFKSCTGAAAQTFSWVAVTGWSGDGINLNNSLYGPIDVVSRYRIQYGLASTAFEPFNYGGLAPIRTSADPTAEVVSSDPADMSAVIGGTGEPGATIIVTGPGGPVETVVDPEGNWSVEVPGLEFGDNVLPVKQVVDGEPDKDTSVTVPLAPADLTAEVGALDNEAGTAQLVGTGHPGATIIIEGPNGPIETTVGADGNWSADVPGLVDGDNLLPVTQKVDGAADQTVELTVTIVAGPIANPLVAGILAAAAAAVAVPVMIRRRKTAQV